LIQNTEDEAERTAQHIVSMLSVTGNGLESQIVDKEISTQLQVMLNDFNIIKAKIFSAKGVIVFSTDSKDLGAVNSKPYFLNTVAKGGKYTKIVEKDARSLEDQIVTIDVAETYVPIMDNGVFVGAFEIYYDISEKRKALNALVTRSSITLLIFAPSLFLLVVFILSKTAHSVSRRKDAEAKLSKSHEKITLQKKELAQRVEERTLELKKTYNQLLHAEKLATSGSIAASLAHEFGNPLYGIKGVLTSIAQQNTLPKDHVRMASMAIDECDRMSHLLQSLKDFNRPTSGEKTLTNLNRVIDDIIIFSRRNLERKAIVIKKEYGPVLRPIMVITDQIKQVIMNLISNSIQACAKGGVISISTSANENNDIIRIRDNGHGIKEGDLPHIFEPFFTTKNIAMGTGLGLSVSYGIIRRHGGTIEVESKPGEGATFTITLPTDDKEDI
jgi:signal transduction histidine kinase